MTFFRKILALAGLTLLLLPPLALAQSVTLDQAVEQVQQETGGKVLSAESRHVGRHLEHRIKVLTPDGHVKVLAISSEPSKNQASRQSTQNTPDRSGGG